MAGEKNRQGDDAWRKSGPQVTRSNKETRRYTKRIIFIFIISIAVLIAVITAQTHYKHSDQRAPEREKKLSLAPALRVRRVSSRVETG